jgi:hypothetical protein
METMAQILHGNGEIRTKTTVIGEDRQRLSRPGRVCMAVLPAARVCWMTGLTIRAVEALPRLSSQWDALRAEKIHIHG